MNQIFDVEYADDIVDGLAVDRNARVTAFGDFFHELVEFGIDGNKIDVDARDHHFFYRRVRQIFDAAYHTPLFFIDNFLLFGTDRFRVGSRFFFFVS